MILFKTNIVLLIIFCITRLSFSQSGWSGSNAGFTTLTKIQFFNQSTGLCVSLDGIVYKSTNGGANWASFCSVSSAYVQSGHFFDLNNYVLVGTNGFHTNGWVGIVKDNVFSSYSFATVLGNLTFVTTYWQNKDTGFVAGTDTDLSSFSGRIHRTTNGGINWSNVTPDSTNNINCISFLNPNTGFIVDPYFKKSTNSGSNWHGTGLPFMPVNDVLPYNSDTMYMCGLFGKVYFSSNGGNAWIERNTGENISLEKIKFYDSKTGWVSGDSGYVFRTTNAGTNWLRQNSGTSKHLYDICLLNSNYLWICGADGIVLRTTNGGITYTPNNGISSPNKFDLSQNYPNPFNQSTLIKLQCPNSGNVSVTVYDASGREVSTLVNEYLTAGTYRLRFEGAGLASGIYYYSLIADGKIINTRKMIVVK